MPDFLGPGVDEGERVAREPVAMIIPEGVVVSVFEVKVRGGQETQGTPETKTKDENQKENRY